MDPQELGRGRVWRVRARQLAAAGALLVLASLAGAPEAPEWLRALAPLPRLGGELSVGVVLVALAVAASHPESRFRQRITAALGAAALLTAVLGFLRHLEAPASGLGHVHLAGRHSGAGLVELLAPAHSGLIALMLAAPAAALIGWPGRTAARLSQSLAGAGFLVATLALMAWLYGVPTASAALGPHGLHPLSALAFLLLSAAVLAAQPEREWMAIASSDSAGGVLIRLLLPAVCATTPLIGWLLLLGYRRKLYDVEFGLSLASFAACGLLGALLAGAAARLHEIDTGRRSALESLRAARDALESRVRERTEKLASLNEWLQRQANLLEQSHDAICVREAPDGRIVYWNAAAEQLYGYSRAEAIGRDGCRLLQISPSLSMLDGLQRDRYWEGEVRCTARDGREILVESRQVLMTQPDGRWHVLETSRDITARKEAQERLRASEERFRSMFEQALDSVFVVDSAGLCQDANPATWRMLRLSRRQLVGRPIQELLAPEDRDRLAELQAALARGGTHRGEWVLLRGDGDRVPVELSASILAGGRWQAVARDIGERRRADQERARHLQEVELLNVRLARSLAETHHRVKNNLQVVAAIVETQQMMAREQVPSAALDRIKHHVLTLAALHDLLTHQAKGDREVEHVAVAAMMNRLGPIIRTAVARAEVTWHADDAFLPVREAGSFALLLNELISNAAKHGGRRIHAAFTLEPATAGSAVRRARLDVTDDGPGFPAGLAPEGLDTMGMDLIHSAATLDLHGTVAFQNRPKGGARVVVLFPLPEQPVPATG